MDSDPFRMLFMVLVIIVIALNFFFSYMFYILRGKWCSISPTWEWIKDIRELKKLSTTSENMKLRKECKFVLNGIYLSSSLLLLGIFLSFLFEKFKI